VNRLLLCLLALAAATAETRPHYGGVLHVELREAIEGADPPQIGPGVPNLFGAFTITRWEPGHRAVFVADENAASGRPFLDGVEVDMGRSAREQSIDLNMGKADVVDLALADARVQQPGRKLWSSSPVRLIALVFRRESSTRVREALALAVDRAAIHRFLLQRQGDITAALLPQWLSGCAFLFPTDPDLAKSKALVAGIPATARSFTLSVDEPGNRAIADRIVLNARDAGLSISIVPAGSAADAQLMEVRIASQDPGRALAIVAGAFGLPEPPRVEAPEAVYNAEHALLEGYRVVPLFHLPDVYGVGPRVRGGPAITPLGEWRFENLWIEGGRP
jgi:ABC-type transport system substrate-binding protein